ncbi:hypothetical protein Hypma_015228 [Hypsizygus marmoreus]|uniref:Uncharacterized protein n=1 Tax=Hypsizygus marmoreus TaxID=39966 RepID=A0A369K373_HYPMA|nr:hypothetical protein Hypma_015228 [Hypsizygus marmoreus]
MNSVSSPPHSASAESSSASQSSRNPDELKQLVASALNVLEQTPPPSLREILGAYRSKGDGDRDMLLAMLNAKTAEDQRLASVAALQRSVLEVYQGAPHQDIQPQLQPRMNGTHHYPTPSFTQSPHLCDKKSRRQHHPQHHHHLPSGSRSPPRVHHHANLPSISMRDGPMSHSDHIPRKRHRSSISPHSPRSFYEPHPTQHTSQHEHLPPSPYSSSGRSDSAEYSPRSRASMAIGSLLSSGPSQEANGDDP